MALEATSVFVLFFLVLVIFVLILVLAVLKVVVVSKDVSGEVENCSWYHLNRQE